MGIKHKKIKCTWCNSIKTKWHRQRHIMVKDIGDPELKTLATYSLCHACDRYFTTYAGKGRAKGVLATKRLLNLVHRMHGLRGTGKCRNPHDGITDAICIAEWAAQGHKFLTKIN